LCADRHPGSRQPGWPLFTALSSSLSSPHDTQRRLLVRAPVLEAFVYDKRSGRKLRKTFTNLAEAKTWRQDALVGVQRQTMRAPSSVTVRDAWNDWVTAAEAGSIRNRNGDAYKPSALRGYQQSMRNHVLEDLGALKISDVRRSDVQALANRLLQRGVRREHGQERHHAATRPIPPRCRA
jgi:hypothetical protein